MKKDYDSEGTGDYVVNNILIQTDKTAVDDNVAVHYVKSILKLQQGEKNE